MMDNSPARQPVSFAAVLRRLRADARLTQEELAEVAGLSPRSISDLERGVSRTARKETARLLADALAIADPARTAFLAAARGKAPACDVLAAMGTPPVRSTSGAATLCGPREVLGLAVHDANPGQLVDAVAAAVGSGEVAGIWLIELTVVVHETTLSPPDALDADAADTGRMGQPNTAEPARPGWPLADPTWLLGGALERTLAVAVTMPLVKKGALALGEQPVVEVRQRADARHPVSDSVGEPAWSSGSPLAMVGSAQ